MKKQVTQRQKDERARRKAMPIALIQRPLNYIGQRDHVKYTDALGKVKVELGNAYMQALMHSNAGRGAAVQAIARGM